MIKTNDKTNDNSKISSHGYPYVVGSGEVDQLGIHHSGNLDLREVKEFTEVTAFADNPCKYVATGELHNLIITLKNELYTWGCNDEYALGREGPDGIPAITSLENANGKPIKAVGCESLSAVLLDNGQVYYWGTFRYSNGVLGFDKTTKYQKVPKLLTALKKEKIINIGSGSNHIILISRKGKVYTMGNGENGVLGRKISKRNTKDSLNPVAILSISKLRKYKCSPYKCSGGFGHTIILTNNGHLFSFGHNGFQQLGLGSEKKSLEVTYNPMPIDISKVDGQIIDIASGEYHNLILTSKNKLYAWGCNDTGQLGISNIKLLQVSTPTPLDMSVFDGKIINISAGTNTSMVITAKGSLYTWGMGTCNQLGHGDYMPYWTPKKVEKTGFKAFMVSGSCQHTIVLGQ